MTKTWCVLMALAVAACGSKEDKKGGSGDKGGDKGGGAADKASGAEAMIHLKKITSSAKEAYNIEGAFPSGKSGPIPAEACCKQADKKCKPSASLWSDAVWRQLSFAVEEPFSFQYSYEGDGKTFTAKAIGCDGKAYTASGIVAPGGKPEISFTEP